MGSLVHRPSPRDEIVDASLVVPDFILNEQRSWDVPKLVEAFDDVSVEHILKLPIPYTLANHSYVWVKNAKGKFTIKSAYQSSQEEKWVGQENALWKRIWGTKMSERLKMLV